MLTQRSARRLTAMLVVALLGAVLMVHGATTRPGVSSTRPAASAAQTSSGSGHSRFVQERTGDDPVAAPHPDVPGSLATAAFTPELVALGSATDDGSRAVVTSEMAASSDRAPPAA